MSIISDRFLLLQRVLLDILLNPLTATNWKIIGTRQHKLVACLFPFMSFYREILTCKGTKLLQKYSRKESLPPLYQLPWWNRHTICKTLAGTPATSTTTTFILSTLTACRLLSDLFPLAAGVENVDEPDDAQIKVVHTARCLSMKH